ncbi:MAG: penicillin-binding protein activator [candidate division WOR-3 bacterium]|nr:penicillin-binding protein activator [candidate division WOR-3 bacterium]
MRKLPLFLLIFFNCMPLTPRLTNIADRSTEHFEAGNNHFKAKEYEKAIIELEKVVRDYPGTEAYEPALYLLTFSYYRINSFEKAAHFGERFVKEFPHSNYLVKILGLLGDTYLKLLDDYRAGYYLIKFYKQSSDEFEKETAYKKIIQLLSEMSLENLERLHRNFLGEPIDEHVLYYLIKAEIKAGKEKDAERDFKLLTRRYPETVYAGEFKDFKKITELGSTSRIAGILLPITGKYARYGEKLKEILKIFDKNNYLPFSTILMDTKSDPVEAIIVAKKLIDEKKVDFIIGPLFSIEALGVAGYSSAKGIPLVVPTNIELKLNSLSMVFTPAQTLEQQARAVARYSIKQLGLNRFAVLFPDIPRYATLAGIFAEEIKKNDGDVIAAESFNPDSVTLRYELERIKRRKPEAIFLAMDADMLINTAPQIYYYGLEGVKILGTESFENEKVIRLGEKYVESAIFATSSIDTTIIQEMAKNGFETSDPLVSKFFQTLWILRQMGGYERVNLNSKLSEIFLKERNFNIWTIRNGEYVKLTELKID